jgi:hypothetical protein
MLKVYGASREETVKSLAISGDWGSVMGGLEVGNGNSEYDSFFVLKVDSCAWQLVVVE